MLSSLVVCLCQLKRSGQLLNSNSLSLELLFTDLRVAPHVTFYNAQNKIPETVEELKPITGIRSGLTNCDNIQWILPSMAVETNKCKKPTFLFQSLIRIFQDLSDCIIARKNYEKSSGSRVDLQRQLLAKKLKIKILDLP